MKLRLFALMMFAACLTGKGATYYVATNGNDIASGTLEEPLLTLQAALVKAGTGNTILMAGGVYLVTNNLALNNSVVVSGLSVEPRDTVIDGGASGFGMTINASSTLRSLTVSNFFRNVTASYGAIGLQAGVISNCVLTCNQSTNSQGRGAAVFMTSAAGLLVDSELTGNSCSGRGGAVFIDDTGATIRKCRIHHNTALSSGGGVYAFTGRLEDCQISDNSGAPGGGASGRFEQGIERCQFVNNTATTYGGGIAFNYQNKGATNWIVDCLFSNNWAKTQGGGIYQSVESTLTLVSNSYFVANAVSNASPGYSEGGGGFYLNNSAGGSVEFSHCVFDRNTAQAQGGAIFINSAPGKAQIRNSLFKGNDVSGRSPQRGGALCLLGPSSVSACTVVGNSAGQICGGIYNEATIGVTNTLLYGNNAGADPDILSTQTAFYSYCCETNGVLSAGQGNVSGDPRFTNAAEGDYTLQSGSSCFNAGVNEEWMTPAVDLSGAKRICGPRVDIGAYECFYLQGTIIRVQ